jgi:ribokinase
MKKICVIGGINIDLVSLSERFPKPGETLLGEQFNIFPGGKGANQAVAAGNLGGNVICVGMVGADAFGKIARDNLQDAHVGVDYVDQAEGVSTGVALIEVTKSGENSIVFIPGANGLVDVECIKRNIAALDEADYILMQLEIAEETVRFVADYAHKHGKTFILDPAPAMQLDAELLGNVDIITPNETEMRIVTGHDVSEDIDIETSAQSLLDAGVGMIINKSGKDGAYIIKKGYFKHVPGFKVEAVDTTAAGDSFNAGLAYALANGESIEDSVRFANAVGAISVTKFGAQSAMPDLKTVNDFLSEQ